MKLGILCGGGPAPGMNSVISAATIEARNSGWDVVGIMDGFQHLIEGQIEATRPLSITDVSRIHVLGGSIIRTSRANPTVRDENAEDPDWRLHACLESLRKLGIDALVTIGGDDTAFSASRLAAAASGGLAVAHVPKTIDNDLPLPGGTPTFGFETARSVGVQLVNNLMTDAITTQRWYLVVAMGRSAGHLALGIGKSAGATLTLIAEEFPGQEPIRLSRLVDVLETSMLKRIALGRPFGVAILAEGIGLRLPQDELLKAMPEVELDEHGHIRLATLELDRLLAKEIKGRFKERGQNITVEGKNIGYELRCAPPIPFDIEYTRDLGYSAVDYLKQVLKSGGSGGMITIQEGHLVPLPFGSFNHPETGRVRIREVNCESSSYRVAREYMIRLDRDDLQDPEKLRPIAAAAGLTPSAFRDRYGYLADDLGGDMAEWEKQIFAINLTVADLERSKTFYREVFGMLPLDEEEDLALFRFKDTFVMLRHEPAHQAPPGQFLGLAKKGVGQFAIVVDDVDAVGAELTDRGVTLISGPADRSWGMRTLTFADPGGYTWSIAQDMP